MENPGRARRHRAARCITPAWWHGNRQTQPGLGSGRHLHPQGSWFFIPGGRPLGGGSHPRSHLWGAGSTQGCPRCLSPPADRMGYGRAPSNGTGGQRPNDGYPNRRPKLGTVHHSNHGDQHTALAFGRTLQAAGLQRP